MTKEKRLELLKKLSQSEYGRLLLDYLEEEIREMKDSMLVVKSLKEVLAKQDAIKILKKTFRFLEALKNKPKGSEKNQYL